MKRFSTDSAVVPGTPEGKAWEAVSESFDRFCLAARIEGLGAMMEGDVEEACGSRHARGVGQRGHRWGRGRIGFHAGKMEIERRRVRDPLASWEYAVEEDWLGN